MPNGKIAHWNHNSYTYIGDANNNLSQIANYSDITSVQNQVNSISGYKYFYYTQYITTAGGNTWTYMTTLPEFSWGVLITYWGHSYTQIRISADTTASAYNCPSAVICMYCKPELTYNMNRYQDGISIDDNHRKIYYAAAASDTATVNDTCYICFNYLA